MFFKIQRKGSLLNLELSIATTIVSMCHGRTGADLGLNLEGGNGNILYLNFAVAKSFLNLVIMLKSLVQGKGGQVQYLKLEYLKS